MSLEFCCSCYFFLGGGRGVVCVLRWFGVFFCPWFRFSFVFLVGVFFICLLVGCCWGVFFGGGGGNLAITVFEGLHFSIVQGQKPRVMSHCSNKESQSHEICRSSRCQCRCNIKALSMLIKSLPWRRNIRSVNARRYDIWCKQGAMTSGVVLLKGENVWDRDTRNSGIWYHYWYWYRFRYKKY